MNSRHVASTPLWRVELLGQLRAVRGNQVIRHFRRHTTGALLAYLAYHTGRPHPRDALIEMLWPECDPAAGRGRLSTDLSSLRRQLEPPGIPAGSVLLADRATVALNEAAIRTDVAEFEARLAAAADARSGMERGQLLAEAVEAYTGELLPGFFEEWVLPERQRLTEAYLQALGQLLQQRERAGDLPRALEYAHRAIAADPLREEGHRELIRLLAGAGQPAAALRQYEELARLLEQAAGTEPAGATRALIRQIQGQQAETPAPTPPNEERSAPSPAAPAPPLSSTSSAPVGTVTFLLAAVQSAQETKDEPARAADRQARLLREVERHQGYAAPQGEGLLLAAFQRPSDALAAAVAGQRTAAGTPASDPTPPAGEADPPATDAVPLPRMALHTGEAEIDAGRYRGLALDHAVRLLRAAHPGQVLVSESTAALLRGETEPGKRGIALTDLGVYRLRDSATGLAIPERLFQLSDPDMSRREFPPPLAEPFHQGRLPLQLTRFFGREEEIARLRGWLLGVEAADQRPASGGRLITLTGPGGSGKTRLALAVAEGLVDCFRGAVWFVPLAEITEARRMVDALFEALGLARSPDGDPLEQIAAFLCRQPSLLLLDNFEQLVAAGTATVQHLRERVPSLTVLVTSRQPLGLAGEQEFPVAPLPTPGASRQATGDSEGAWTESAPSSVVCRLAAVPSVALFVDRAQTVRPDFQVTAANAAAVAELCRRLEGIPLALELAAARAQIVTPLQMLAHLNQRLDFLVTRQPRFPPRHRTLRATLDWSYQVLSPELQQFFARLSVFRGGWTLAAAEAVCRDGEALDNLEQLRQASLVEAVEGRREMRYSLLETLREYGAERLSGEERTALADRHAQYFLALAEEAYPQTKGSQMRFWLDRLEAEHDNLLAALAWFYEREDGAEAGVQLAGALQHLWAYQAWVREARVWLKRMLDRPSPRNAGRVRALEAAGSFARDAREIDAAQHCFDESLAIMRELGDQHGIAEALIYLGQMAMDQEDRERAQSLYEESLAIARALGDRQCVARNLYHLGHLADDRGDWPAARRSWEECRSLDLEMGTKGGRVLRSLGRLAAKEGDYAAAHRFVRIRLIECQEVRFRWGIWECLEQLAELAAEQAQMERSARLWAAAITLWQDPGSPLEDTVRRWYERDSSLARVALGESGFAAAAAEGAAFTMETAIRYALEGMEP